MRYGVERADSSSVEQQRRLLGRLFLSLCADISVDGGWFCGSSEIWGSVDWKGEGNMEQKNLDRYFLEVRDSHGGKQRECDKLFIEQSLGL